MKCRFCVLFLFICVQSYTQTQTCPVNINFASGDLTHWYAYTGNNRLGNGPNAIGSVYDSIYSTPLGTKGARSISEFGIQSIKGIQVITVNGRDPFGNFSTIPTVNGYNYNYSIMLGSTTITRGAGSGAGGGLVRGITYSVRVPPGPVTEPYTMTYAYAMVLENGTHVSEQQRIISATLKTPAGVIDCASPSYFLPTFNDVSEGGRGATLDSATAKRNGFVVSNEHSPNQNPDASITGIAYLQDIWTKGWTEVTFDLSPYRGQQVSLSFEADNCMPGGHFAYAYIAIRNSCAGLQISGDSLVCNNSITTYSVPSLSNASYVWNIPASWQILTADTSNIIQVRSSSAGGLITVREKNSCADLTDTIQINTLPSPEAGILTGSTTVCTGENNSTLKLLNYSGVIGKWQASTDSLNWLAIPDNTAQYLAENLDTTTMYRVIVGKGTVCPADTSLPATIMVDKKTVGGELSPLNATLCAGQTAGETLTLTGNTGAVKNWQYSEDGISWLDLVPGNATPVYTVKGIIKNTQYRLIDKNGVCPADTSSVASILFDPVAFPEALITPADTTICYGTVASLNASIQIGTSYTWFPVSTGNNSIGGTPYNFVNQVSPENTTDYILRVLNNGCPNPLLDTFHVEVLTPVIVDAGRDTSVVVGEPLQFHALSSDPGPDGFSWTPSSKLSDPAISDPLATYSLEDNIIKYTVKATTPFGCSGEGFITVKVFKTKPDIFMPNAFTPGQTVNSIFRPIPVGISSLDYFRIYNRLGQLVYSTSALGRGWDGLVNGLPQSAGGYVWMVKGTDYTGNVIVKKGTMVLIR